MKVNVDKLKEIARPRNEEEQKEADFRRENREWLQISGRLALKIRKILREKGMSQVELAQRLGVTPAQVSKLLSGKVNFELSTLIKLQNALGQKLVYLEDEALALSAS
ncbi:MAG: helix-turn-helix domain-containing protein [Bacteroidales bacterium]|nr:helix-turn-helix domain-containing protein [Bacteroidales bacterium]